ncbi:MAG: hypothetical protein GXY70_04170 [Euryarchaeota archaeon]|nr:hypothetical protein [Euryarchaeota archaeon]
MPSSQLVRLRSGGNLAAGLAHDLNDTLTAIVGHVGGRRDVPGPESLAKHLNAIEGAAERDRGPSRTLVTFS